MGRKEGRNERRQSWAILRYYSSNSLERPKKTMKTESGYRTFGPNAKLRAVQLLCAV
jgi:hypothetical protein